MPSTRGAAGGGGGGTWVTVRAHARRASGLCWCCVAGGWCVNQWSTLLGAAAYPRPRSKQGRQRQAGLVVQDQGAERGQGRGGGSFASTGADNWLTVLQTLFVQRKAGALSYADDPSGKWAWCMHRRGATSSSSELATDEFLSPHALQACARCCRACSAAGLLARRATAHLTSSTSAPPLGATPF